MPPGGSGRAWKNTREQPEGAQGQRLELCRHNEIPKKEVKWYMILLRQFTSSMAIMIEIPPNRRLGQGA